MTQPVFIKVYIGRGEKITVDKAVTYKQTAKLIRDIIFDCDRYGDQYPKKQVRIDELLKFHDGFFSQPSSGCVYCFEEDFEKAKQVLLDCVNKRVEGMLKRFRLAIEEHNRRTANATGVNLVNLNWEIK